VLDACVLIPPGVRDLLLSCADERLFRPVWQSRIEDEVIRNVTRMLTDRGDDPGDAAVRANHVIAEMNRAFEGACLDDEAWTSLEESMPNNKKDRHVLAAAVTSRATHLVTENDRDFPRQFAEGQIVRVDAFLGELLTESPDQVIAAIEAMSARATRPPMSPLQLAERFAAGQLAPRSGGRLVDLLRRDPPDNVRSLRSTG